MKKIKFSSEILTFFSAFCFVGAWIEYILPKPLPFLRLGLANFPLIIAAILLRPGPFFILALTKIFCQCLSGGTFFSHIFVFSLCSTLTSATIMFILSNLFYPKMISMSGLSVAGALGTNLMQAMLAKIFFGFNFFAVAVPLIGMGAVTSVILGIFADFFFRNSRVAKMLQEDRFELPLLRPIVEESALKPKIFFTILGFILLLAIIFVKNTVFIAGIFVLVLVLNLCSGIKVSWKITVFFALSIVVFNLFSPVGKVLLAVGNFNITQGALTAGIKKALRIQGMIFISRWIFKNNVFPRGKFTDFFDGVLLLANRFTENFKGQKWNFSPKLLVDVIDETILKSSRD